MKKILVPVDFSQHTDISTHYAVEIATVYNAEILLFHAFFDQIYLTDSSFSTGYETNVMITEELIREFFTQKQNMLSDLKDRLMKSLATENKASVTIKTQIESGEPEYQILNVIEHLQPDLIIMGSSGIGKKNFLVGSVSKKIMENTTTPVLAIPATNEYNDIRNILYVTELSAPEQHNLKKIFKLFQGFNIQVHCLHLNQETKDQEPRNKMHELECWLEEKYHKENFSCHVINCKHPQDVIETFVKLKVIDMIAFIPHKRSTISNLFSKDLTERDLFQTNIPILAIQ